MDFLSVLPGILGGLGSLFGGNSAQNEANKLKKQELGLQDRALRNYEKGAAEASGYRNQGSPYLQKQGEAYGNLGQMGRTDRGNAQTLLNQLLPMFAQFSGVQG